MTFRKECEKYIFPTINKFQLLASYFNVIFTSKPIYLFWSIQSIIMIYFLEYITYLNTSIKIHRIKTYLYEDALQKKKKCLIYHCFAKCHINHCLTMINLIDWENNFLFIIYILRLFPLQKLQICPLKKIIE